MPFVSVTRVRLRRSRHLPAFYWRSLLSIVQAKRAEGNLHTSVLRDADNAFWTLTAWTDERAMRAFMTSGPHKAAMPKLIDWCDEAHVAHWMQDSAALPSWPEAYTRLLAEGRKSKVRHPSPRHESMQLPPPRA